jgi:3-isopropylmalate/(R)-2-methylmalate dehydratase small subunit
MKNFNGKVLFLDRSDINTDEIIPARYLTELTREDLEPFLLEDLDLDGFSTEDLKEAQVIVTRENYGCGSSREHAPWAMEVNGINLVIAENFARIFRQNMYNNGMMAVELETSVINDLFQRGKGKKVTLSTDVEHGTFTFDIEGEKVTVDFTLTEFDRALVQAGGWVEYADSHY